MVSILVIIGSLALAGGGVGYLTFPMTIKYAVVNLINLKENGMVYPVYMNPTFPTRSTFHFYEITNPREVLKGKKMKFRIKGPYNFDTYMTKDGVEFKQSGQVMRYLNHRKLHAREDISADMDEQMWLINPIVPTTAKTVRAMVLDRLPFQRVSEPVVFNAVNLILDNYKERLIRRMTPRQLLFGRELDLFSDIEGLAKRFGLASLLPPGPPNNIFGLAYFQNETVDEMEIWTGISPKQNKFADVNAWRKKNSMSIWEGKCNTIDGTNGELYKPFIKEGKSIRIFLAQLCRTLYLDPVGDGPTMTESGIRTLEYELSPRSFMGARSNPNNKCFCTNKKAYDCQYDGLLNMGPCFFEAPIYFTRPNFRGVDKRILALVEEDTLATNLSEKQSFWLDQTTGSILQVSLTLVGTFKVVKQPYLGDLARVQNLTYAPLFAATESVVVPGDVTFQIKALQIMTDNYQYFTLGPAAIGGVVLVLKMFF